MVGDGGLAPPTFCVNVFEAVLPCNIVSKDLLPFKSNLIIAYSETIKRKSISLHLETLVLVTCPPRANQN
jgi:hypothetical protein